MLIGEKVLSRLRNANFVSQLRPSRPLRLSLLLYGDKDGVTNRDEFQFMNATSPKTTIIFVLMSLEALTSDESSLREFFELWQQQQGLNLEILIDEEKIMWETKTIP